MHSSSSFRAASDWVSRNRRSILGKIPSNGCSRVPVAFVLEFFVVEKLATALAFTFMRPTDRPQFITYAISLMIVCIMCPVMSLVATLLFKEPSFGTWVHTWGCNFPMALCWQMFYCGPLSRFIFRSIFRKQLQAENQEQH